MKSERGNTTVELALVLLPFLIMMCGAVDVLRGVWTYQALSSSVQGAVRYASVHGASCAAASATCAVTIADITGNIQQHASGLGLSSLTLTFNAGPKTVLCSPASSCLANASVWPPASNNVPGASIGITGAYDFSWMLSPLWAGQNAPPTRFTSVSTETIEF